MKLTAIHELIPIVIAPHAEATIAWQPSTSAKVLRLVIDKPGGLELLSMRLGAVEQMSNVQGENEPRPLPAELFASTAVAGVLELPTIGPSQTFSFRLRNVTDKPIPFTGRVFFAPR